MASVALALTVVTSGLASAGCAKAELTPSARAALSPAVTRAQIGAPRKGDSRAFSARAAREGRGVREGLASGGDAISGSDSQQDAPIDDNVLDATGRAKLSGQGPCPEGMASIDGAFCVDRWEASLVEVLPNGDERPWAPYESVEGRIVKAQSVPGVVPQGYVSQVQAAEACFHAGKRLCKASEWLQACEGPSKKRFGYGSEERPRTCNDRGRSPMMALFGAQVSLERPTTWNWERMNDPSLNQVPGTLAPTGVHEACTNDYGVYDMVGNLHEWIEETNRGGTGTFAGGYYLDTHLNGEGCHYRTRAHAPTYHDYSTGFRCCADPRKD
jgi:hypothetical protein